MIIIILEVFAQTSSNQISPFIDFDLRMDNDDHHYYEQMSLKYLVLLRSADNKNNPAAQLMVLRS